MTVDCTECHYAATGQATVVCCYYGEGETDPYGDCEQFEPKEGKDDLG